MAEMMVVIGIIGLLLSIVMASILESRKSARDRQRAADLAQVEFAVSSYYQVNNRYPTHDGGIGIGFDTITNTPGSTNFDNVDIDPFWGSPIKDPINDSTYHYVYDSDLTCGSEKYVAVIATTMERNGSSNASEVCSTYSATPNAYIMIIAGPKSTWTSGSAGTIDPCNDWWLPTFISC